jgi:hypothetical protein
MLFVPPDTGVGLYCIVTQFGEVAPVVQYSDPRYVPARAATVNAVVPFQHDPVIAFVLT